MRRMPPRCSTPWRRNCHSHSGHPYPQRSFAEYPSDQGGDRRAGFTRKDFTAPRGRASKARSTVRKSGADRNFRPDIEVKNGDVIEGQGFALERSQRPATPPTIWRSPGERKINFVGDHVMGWSTSIVAPPDGSMIDYMASLDRWRPAQEDLYFRATARKSGSPALCPLLARHRRAREASILHRLAKGEARYSHHGSARSISASTPRLTGARRLFRAGASGRSGRARHRGDGGRSGDRRDLSDGVGTNSE